MNLNVKHTFISSVHMCALMQYLKMLEGNLFKFDTQG